MQSLFPGINRSTVTSYDKFMEKDAQPVADITACSKCGIEREDWVFDIHMVCASCGDVVERPIDSGAEYRFFGLEERGGGDPCRVGAPMDTRFPTSGLGTMI